MIREQIRVLAETLDYSAMDFALEVSANSRAVFLHYLFWRAAGGSRPGIEPNQLASAG